MNFGDVDMLISTYGLLRRCRKLFCERQWHVLVIDEAPNIKNSQTLQARVLKTIPANHRIAMSGTPVENRLTELWSIFDFLNRGYLGSLKNFKHDIAMPIERFRDLASIEKLRLLTAPFILRRLKSDRSVISDLPEKMAADEYCTLTKEHAVLYEHTVQDLLQKIERCEGMERNGYIFKLMTNLKQICNHPVHFSGKGRCLPEHSGKTERAMDLLEKIHENGEKALLFTQYREMGGLLAAMITEKFGTAPLFFHGSLERKEREKIIDDFQNNRGKNVLILSLKAGGTGLNLTAATNVIHFDLWWNPAVEDQATDRAYRIGQMKNVMVRRLISLGTFEEKIDEVIRKKRELAGLTVPAGESWITELSNDEIKELFLLHKSL
jgi:SNF2 family DNA or RNA helicase